MSACRTNRTFRNSTLPPQARVYMVSGSDVRPDSYIREIRSDRRHRYALGPTAAKGGVPTSGRPCGRIHGIHTQEALDGLVLDARNAIANVAVKRWRSDQSVFLILSRGTGSLSEVGKRDGVGRWQRTKW